MAELHLPRLSGSVVYIDQGKATPSLQGDWQSAVTAIELAFASIASNLTDIVTAQAAADAAQNDAIAAQDAADGKQTASAVLTYLATAVSATAAGVKSLIGLSQVDDVSDINKPVSTLQAAALALKAPLASPVFTGTIQGDGLRLQVAPSVSAATVTHTVPVNFNGTVYYVLVSNVP